jgi:hypothetical protein
MAWLRLTASGLRKVIEDSLSDGEAAEAWIERTLTRARQGDTQRYPIEFVEAITDALSPEHYRVGQDVRSVKRDLGQRKGGTAPTLWPTPDVSDALKHLTRVSKRSPDPVLRTAAKALQEYLQ